MPLEQAWWEHLGRVRWFGGKGTPGAVTRLEPLAWYTEPDAVPAVRSEIATIDYADGRREFYHLLVAHYPAGTAPVPALATSGDADVVDATTDPAAVAAFVEACRTGRVQGMSWGRPQPAPWATGVWGGEQSNTTITLGGEALFKLFRRIEPGANLDAETLDTLDGTGVPVPELLGRLTAAWPTEGRDSTDLGMAIERVPGARDGWQLASAACAAGTGFAEDARSLGAALASVHRALATALGTDRASGDELADRMTGRLDEATAAASVLKPYREPLASAFDALRGRELAVQRIHGDFHLGQTLRSALTTEDGPGGGHRWWIIDFEGEPVKSAAERRAPDSVWRDVAGMLRSFDYARSAHAEPDSDAVRTWAAQARTAFVEGYCGATDDAPEGLLAAYETDKAVYEVVYETRNRPDWVRIPLRAVADRASAAGQAR